jgi:hypothetical protein
LWRRGRAARADYGGSRGLVMLFAARGVGKTHVGLESGPKFMTDVPICVRAA